MKTLLRLLALLVLVAPLAAQNFSTIQASAIYGPGSVLLSSGTMSWQAVDTTGAPISYQVGGGGQQVTYPTVCSVQKGAIKGQCSVATTDLTNPVNVCFMLTIKDAQNRLVLGGPNSGYQCMQPTSSANDSSWCTGGVCNFDRYVPNLAQAGVLRIKPPSANSLGGVYAHSCPSLVGQKATGTLATGDPDCEPEDSRPITLILESPSPLDSGKFCYLGNPNPITVTRVSASAVGGTVQVNLDARSNASWSTPGTPILGSSLSASGSTADTTTIAYPSVPKDSPLCLLIPNISGQPSLVSVRVYYVLQ